MGFAVRRTWTVAAGGAALIAGLVAAVPASAAPDGLDFDLEVSQRDRVEPLPEPPAPQQRGQSSPTQDQRATEVESPEFRTPFDARAAEARPLRRTGLINEEYQRDPVATAGNLLSRVDVTQDLTSGVIEARATFRAVPTSESVVIVVLGQWRGGNCLPRAAVLAGAMANQAAGSFYNDVGDSIGTFAASRSRSDRVLTVRSSSVAALKTAAYDCTWADVRKPDASGNYQEFKYHDLTEHFAPSLSIDPGAPVQGSYRGKWTKMRLDVYNASQSPAGNVTIKPQGKGLQFKPKSRNLGTIDKRSTRYGVEFRVRLKGKKKQRKATFVANAGGRKFTKKVTIAQKPRPKRYKSLAGRYFWGHLPAAVDKGWDNRAVWFLDRKWAYLDFAKNGKKPRCKKQSKHCKRYTYNPRKGVARIGGKKVKINTEGFRFKVAKKDEKAYFYPTTLAKRKQRFNVKLIRHDFTGMCGIWCNTWTEWLSMDKKGRFVLSSMSISSLGPPGVGSIFSSVPPDNRGTYQVGANGRVLLRFASGKKERHTLAIEHDVRGKASPAGAGLLLGDRNFYRD